MLRVRDRSLLHRGARFDFERITLEDDAGREHHRDVVRHPGAVVVLPVLGAGERLVLIRNQRPAVGSTLWELPAGTLEAAEKPETCAARELEEETGFTAGALRRLGSFYTTPGLTDEHMHAFIASDLTRHEQRLDDGEQIEVHVLPIERVWAMVDSGELCDAKSVLTMCLAQRAGLIPPHGGEAPA